MAMEKWILGFALLLYISGSQIGGQDMDLCDTAVCEEGTKCVRTSGIDATISCVPVNGTSEENVSDPTTPSATNTGVTTSSTYTAALNGPDVTVTGGSMSSNDITVLNDPDMTSTVGSMSSNDITVLNDPDMTSTGGSMSSNDITALNDRELTSTGGSISSNDITALNDPDVTFTGGLVSSNDTAGMGSSTPDPTSIGVTTSSNYTTALNDPDLTSTGGSVSSDDTTGNLSCFSCFAQDCIYGIIRNETCRNGEVCEWANFTIENKEGVSFRFLRRGCEDLTDLQGNSLYISSQQYLKYFELSSEGGVQWCDSNYCNAPDNANVHRGKRELSKPLAALQRRFDSGSRTSKTHNKFFTIPVIAMSVMILIILVSTIAILLQRKARKGTVLLV